MNKLLGLREKENGYVREQDLKDRQVINHLFICEGKLQKPKANYLLEMLSLPPAESNTCTTRLGKKRKKVSLITD